MELAFISLEEDELTILCEDLATLLELLLLWLWFVVSICDEEVT